MEIERMRSFKYLEVLIDDHWNPIKGNSISHRDGERCLFEIQRTIFWFEMNLLGYCKQHK